MEISAKHKVCGLLADPIGHSLSPLLQNSLAELTGENLVYVPLPVTKEHLSEAVTGAYAMGFLGMNVSLPHKTAVMEWTCDLDDTARLVGAVNTLVRTDKGYKGYNTDYYGLFKCIERAGQSLKHKPVVVLGAGGAAHAAIALAVTEQASSITILNRTEAKACELAEFFAKKADCPVYTGDLSRTDLVSEKAVLIQTTKAGMTPDTTSPVQDPAFFQKAAFGVDIVFNPAKTPFLKQCEAANIPGVPGLPMLLYQGIAAFSLWTGKEVSEEHAEAVLQKMEQKLYGEA